MSLSIKKTVENFHKSLELEEERKRLARLNDFTNLKKLYGDSITELPQMNTNEKWDFFSFRTSEMKDPITINRIKEVVNRIPNQSEVLDYGCGYCYVLEEAINQEKEWFYTGVDFSAGFVNNMKVKYPNYKFYHGDIAQVSDKKFDYVMILEVLEHITPSQTMGFLSSFKKFLKPKGQLVVTVPLYEDLLNNTSPCWVCGCLGNVNGHVRSYTPELIIAELKLAGYKVEAKVPIYGSRTAFGRLLRKIKWQVLSSEKYLPTNYVVFCEVDG